MEKVETHKQQPPLPLQQQPPPPPPPPPPRQFNDSMVYGRVMKKKPKGDRMNEKMRRSAYYPKSPLMIFSELFEDIPIHLQESTLHNGCMSYTATFEIDGQIYYGNDTSTTQAKEEACEKFLRTILAKKFNELPVSPMNAEVKFYANRPYKKGFPWQHFVSLAMYNLLNQWKILPVDSVFFKPHPKIVAMKNFPENPKKYNPIQLINKMKPESRFTVITEHKIGGNCLFQVNCVIDDILFTGKGLTRKVAKKECCIAAIKYFWQFDFHAKNNN